MTERQRGYEVVWAEIVEAPSHEGDGLQHADSDVTVPGVAGAVASRLVMHAMPGVHIPWKTGDRCLVLVPCGDPAMGAVPVASPTRRVAPLDPQSMELAAPAGGHLYLRGYPGEDASEVRLGDGDSYQPLMMYTQAAGELGALKAQVDALAGIIDRLIATNNPPSPAPVTGAAAAAVEAAEYADGHIGGEWSQRVKAVPETQVGVG